LDEHGTLSAALVAKAGEFTVRGCRTMAGEFRGVSLFDRTNSRLRNRTWYKIPKGAKIPPALAVTRDSAVEESSGPVHYTVAPKDDMQLSLFLQSLKDLTAQSVKGTS
jgi:hypothetical protein